MGIRYKANYDNIISGLDSLETIGLLDNEAKAFLIKKTKDLVQGPYYERFNRLLKTSPSVRDFVIESFRLPKLLKISFFPKKKTFRLTDDAVQSQLIRVDVDNIERKVDKDYEKIFLNLRQKDSDIFEYELALDSDEFSVNSVFTDKAISIVTSAITTLVAFTALNVESYLSISIEKNKLQNKVLESIHKKKNFELVNSALFAVSELNSVGIYDKRLAKEIVNFADRFSDSISSFSKLSSQYSEDDIYNQILSLSAQDGSEKKDEDFLRIVARDVQAASEKSGIDYKIFLSIINTESHFSQSAVSSTGDYSLAQINFEKCRKERIRLGLSPLDLDRLKKDSTYAIEIMTDFLSYLKNRYAKTDRLWYARYHSKTMSKKLNYAKKLEKTKRALARNEIESFNVAVKNIEVMLDEVIIPGKTPGLQSFRDQIIHARNVLNKTMFSQRELSKVASN